MQTVVAEARPMMYEAESSGANEYPLRELRVELTHDCPLECLHCSSCSGTAVPRELSAQRVLRLIQEFAAIGGEELILTGGEPLMYDGLLPILASSRALGIRTVLYSCGVVRMAKGRMPVHRDTMLELRPFLDRVVFSVYSRTPEVHDAVTQVDGSSVITIEAIDTAVELGIPTDIHFVPMRLNYRDLPGVVALGDQLGINCIRVLRFVPHGRATDHLNILDPTPHDYDELARAVATTAERYPNVSLHIGASFNSILPGVENGCLAATRKLVVTANGSVAPCDGFKNFGGSIGLSNINANTLYEIWRGSPLISHVRAVRCGFKNVALPEAETKKWAGCIAQKSLRAGYVTQTMLDPCASPYLRDSLL